MSRTTTDARPFCGPGYDRLESVTEAGQENAALVQLPDFMLRPNDEHSLTDEEARLHGERTNRELREPKPTIIRQERVVEVRHDQMVYPMNSRPKGLFLCINNIKFQEQAGVGTRLGAEKDEENIMILFRKLGYRTQCFRDLDYEKFRNCIQDFAKRPELFNICSVVVSVMSHGHGTKVSDTDVLTTDGIPVKCEWIIEQFDVKNCPAMHKKPKIFLFQFCRGEGIGASSRPLSRPISIGKVQSDGVGSSKFENVRVGDDVLIAFATIRGNVAHRDISMGSWFIQAICKVYTRYACDSDIKKLHTKVDFELEHCCADNEIKSRQTCETVDRGFKDFYFSPGVY